MSSQPSRFDALIVGGGPAGSSCARLLVEQGWKVLVLDRARFPRDKVCAGWITPGVLRALALDPAVYRTAGLVMQDITAFRVAAFGATGVEVRYPEVVSYAIRRCEFDTYLLRRSGAALAEETPVTSLGRARERWIVNDSYEAPVLVGAGGHFCPVSRHVAGGRDHREPVVAQELEFRLDERSSAVPEAPELFFCRDLEGYAWCVRKGDYLNVGIGRRRSDGFSEHRRAFATFLERTGRIPTAMPTRWHGHAYFAAGAGIRPLAGDGVLLAGDAAGLAWPSSGEGIAPAVFSGIAAARTLIEADGVYSSDRLRPYAESMRREFPPVASDAAPGRIKTVAGRTLLRSRLFARHVVLDRWFLRRMAQAGVSSTTS